MANRLRVRRWVAVALQSVVCAGCAAAQAPDDSAVCAAYNAGRSHLEVVADGTIDRILGVQAGRVSPHEGFLLRLGSGCTLVVRVEVNTYFTGDIPLRSGERVLVKGEYEYYALGGVIHWTHGDPRGHHDNGYVQAGGTMYF